MKKLRMWFVNLMTDLICMAFGHDYTYDQNCECCYRHKITNKRLLLEEI